VQQRDKHDHERGRDPPVDVESERGRVIADELRVERNRLREPDEQGREARDVAEHRVPERRQVAILASRTRDRVRDRRVRARTGERGDAADDPREQDAARARSIAANPVEISTPAPIMFAITSPTPDHSPSFLAITTTAQRTWRARNASASR
jgi:hypothetical protein